ncbi:MAG: hypothetical protein ACYSUL_04200 [Planctomycetota bacterium]
MAKARQEKRHKQGWGTASVDDLLGYIKDDIPRIAKESNVDIIVSKWDVVYKNPSVQLIDVTYEIIKPFKPSEENLENIRKLEDLAPLPREEWEKMDHKD